MGGCNSQNEEETPITEFDDMIQRDQGHREINNQIHDRMLTQQIHDTRVKRLLLLGAGSSGKSTLFKQLKCISGSKTDGRIFAEKDCMEARATIRYNCLAGILLLLKKSQEIADRNPESYKSLKINLDIDPELVEDREAHQMILDIRLCMAFHSEQFLGVLNRMNETECQQAAAIEEEDNDPEYIAQWLEKTYANGVSWVLEEPHELNWKLMRGLACAIDRLWHNPIWRDTYQLRGVEKYAIIENMDYFFDRAKVVFRRSYYPITEDHIKVRMRTTGIVEATYATEQKDMHLQIFDVGGQRSERRKWIQQFANITAIIYVAALNHYCAVLFEDERVNAMHESLDLFEEVCDSKHFRTTEIILFLNGDDLFQARLREGKSLSVCFNDKDWDYKGESYHGPNFTDPLEIRPPYYMKATGKGTEPVKVELKAGDEDSWFDYVYHEGLKFIHRQYVKQNKNSQKAIFVHVTNATSANSTQQVFVDVQNIVIRANLKRSGLV